MERSRLRALGGRGSRRADRFRRPKEFGGLNLSYHLQPESWGQGYATELVRETLAFAFDELHAERVIGLVRPINAASSRILEKCGFRFEREVMLHGAPTNMYALGS